MEPTTQRSGNMYLDVRRLFSGSWELYWASLGTISTLLAVNVAIFIATSWLAGPDVLGFLIRLVSILVQIYFFVAAAVAVASPGRLAIGSLLQQAGKKYLPLAYTFLLSAVIIAGGATLLIVPGLVFAPWFCFAVYVVLTGGPGGFAALGLSKEYSRGLLWKLWVYFLIYLIIWFAFFLSITALANFTLGVTGLNIAGLLVLAVVFFLLNSVTFFGFVYGLSIFRLLQQRKGVLVDAPKATVPLAVGLAGFCLLLVFAALGAAAPKTETETQSSATSSAGIIQQVRLNALKLAIGEYRKDRGAYPATLQALVPEYVDSDMVNLADFTYTFGSGGAKVCTLAEPQQCLSAS